MANVTGPTRNLPGHIQQAPKGMTCDEHPDRPAIKRITTEVDSFGSEEMDVCDECFNEFKVGRESLRQEEQKCDICHNTVIGCRPFRDPAEGSYGPVYTACPSCIKKVIDDFAD